jgi:succinate-semialdehyde dehydrogenase/glutarate-semialdehyde dehydrogenase
VATSVFAGGPPTDAPEIPRVLGSYVDGELVEGGGSPLVAVDPSTGETIARIRGAGPELVDRAVETAVLAAALWRSSPFEERARKLRALAKLVLRHADDLATLIAREQGKPRLEALTLEILPCLDHLRFLAGQGEHFAASERIDRRQPLHAHKEVHDLYDPLGVVAFVTPFPLPFGLPLIQTATALTLGNAVVLKPSERTPLCALKMVELIAAAGFPPGVVNVVNGDVEEAVRLASHPRVDKIFFAGTTDAGRQIMATAGCAPTPVVLSLSGKHATVVAEDADLKLAAKGVTWGALANAGQNCGAVERVYVHEAVAQRFVEQVLEEVDRLRIGDPLEEGTDLGPLISEGRRLDVHEQVMDAVEMGGKLLRGGHVPRGSGFFYPPTVVFRPPDDCRLMREETLGPVIPIVVVESLERGILLANDSDYALTASGWTRSQETAERLGVALQAGSVTVNDVLYGYGEPGLTWSGYRKSGIGHVHGLSGLREMSRKKSVSFDRAEREAPVFAFPYDEGAARFAAASIQALHGAGIFRRLRSLLRLVRQRRFRARVPLRSFLVGYKQRPW